MQIFLITGKPFTKFYNSPYLFGFTLKIGERTNVNKNEYLNFECRFKFLVFNMSLVTKIMKNKVLNQYVIKIELVALTPPDLTV